MGPSGMRDALWSEFVATRQPHLRDALITDYAPLVRFVASRLSVSHTSLLENEDLLSYGMIGLITAIDRFDPSRGVRFEAFATSRIRGAIIDQLRTLNWLPRSVVASVRQIEWALATLTQRLGRSATEQEAAAELGVSLDCYRQMLLETGMVVLSLDAPFGAPPEEEEIASLCDVLEDSRSLEPTEEVERRELTAMLGAAIEQLPERERLLLILYYYEELTMKEIGKVLRVSASRVSQLHMQAVLRLRAALQAQHEAGEQSSLRPLRAASGSRHSSRR